MSVTWKIRDMDRAASLNGQSDVVCCVHYTVMAGAGDNLAGISGQCELDTDNLSDFVPFASLTEEAVAQWVKNKLGSEAVAAMEASATAQSAEKAAPKMLKGGPWIPEPAKISVPL